MKNTVLYVISSFYLWLIVSIFSTVSAQNVYSIHSSSGTSGENVNLIKNWNFSEGLNTWNYWIDDFISNPELPVVESGVAVLKTGSAHDGYGWHYQFFQQGFAAVPNVPYVLKFKAWSDSQRSNSVIFEDTPEYMYNRYGASSDQEAKNGRSEWIFKTGTTPRWFTFHVVFDQMKPATIQKIIWHLSTANSKIYLDSIILAKENEPVIFDPGYLSTSQTSIKTDATATEIKVDVHSNVGWQVSSDQPWITVTPETGTGVQTIAIKVSENTTYSDRNATITLTSNSTSPKQISILQKGKPYIPDTNGEPTSGVNWENSVWTTWNLIRNWNFTAELNYWNYWIDSGISGQEPPDASSGVATMKTGLSGDGYSWQYQLLQQGLHAEPDIPYLLKFKAWSDEPRSNGVVFEDSPAQMYNRYGASSDPESVNGRSEWTYYTTSTPRWYTFHVTFDQIVPQTEQKIQWMLSTANTTSYLDSIILIRDGLVFVNDSSYCRLSETDILFGSLYESKTFKITSNTKWSIVSDQPWISVNPNTGTGNAVISLSVSTNPWQVIRTGNITVQTDSSGTRNINITQRKNEQTQAPDENSVICVTVSAAKGSAETFINSAPESPVFCDQSWIKVSPTTGNGEQKVSMDFEANESYAARKAIITIWGQGAGDQLIEVTQTGKNEVAQNTGDADFGELWTADTWNNLNLIKNWSFTAQLDNWGYWTDSGVSGQETPNVSSGMATMHTGLSDDGYPWHYQFFQNELNAEPNILYILKFKAWSTLPRSNTIVFEDGPAQNYNRYGASTDPEAINGRSEWVFQTDTIPKWFTFHVVFDQITPESMQKVQWMLSTSNSTFFLDSTILIKNIDLLAEKNVDAILSATHVTIPPTKSRAIVNLNSNTKCMAVSDQTWLTVDPSNINGTQSINLIADENKTDEYRTAIVTIFPAGLNAQTITVNQTSVTGIAQRNKGRKLAVYPTPTSGIVNIVLDNIPNQAVTVIITDLSGKIRAKQVIQNKEGWIDLTGNPKGVYLLKTSYNEETLKIILK